MEQSSDHWDSGHWVLVLVKCSTSWNRLVGPIGSFRKSFYGEIFAK